MDVSRSSVYAAPAAGHDDAVIVAEIRAITDAFAAYGYRRVGAELRHRWPCPVVALGHSQRPLGLWLVVSRLAKV
jgi:hypothetical protein